MGFRPAQLMHSLDQDRKNLTHLARATSGKKTDQIRIAFEIDLIGDIQVRLPVLDRSGALVGDVPRAQLAQ